MNIACNILKRKFCYLTKYYNIFSYWYTKVMLKILIQEARNLVVLINYLINLKMRVFLNYSCL